MKTIDLSSAYLGITTPLGDIVAQIEQQGWTVGKIKWGKDSYIARATNPHGETIEKTGVTDATAAANVLLAILRLHQLRTSAQKFAGMWGTTWVNHLQEIAEAYAKAPVYDPKAVPAWVELANDSTNRARVLQQQLKIEVVDDPEPYANAQEMANDIHTKRHFFVSRANAKHPVWSVDQNVAFRIVHDILGHAVSGGDFGWYGENLACAAHFPLLSPVAQKALFTECIAQTGYAIYYRGFGPQKVAYLDEFIEPIQQKENDPAHTGIHPSQSVAPVGMPKIEPQRPEEGVQMDPGYLSPHKVDAITNAAPVGIFSKIAITLRDPNHGWQSNAVSPPGLNAQTDMGLQHPETGEWVDPLDAQASQENARLVDRQWFRRKKEDGSPDYTTMKQAIVNAFRVVLLSPRKDLRWNAVHYQDIAHIPSDETNPKVYWNALEKARQQWNVRHFGEAHRYLHREFKHLMPLFVGVLQNQFPNYKVDQLWEKADEIIFDWEMEEENKIEEDERDKEDSKKASATDVYKKIQRALTKRIEGYIQPGGAGGATDFNLFGEPVVHIPKIKLPTKPPSLETGTDEGKYGAFMGTHLQAIANISDHIDDILEAALEDVREHDGAGHNFRAKVLGMNIPGVGPKVCSFAWLLLNPMTSQLGTIDTHMLDVLGGNEKDFNNRDYFKYERMLQAGRDAAGYSNVPLGQFQWSMWDYKRTGPGSHQDHSSMAPLDPVPHEDINWASKVDPIGPGAADAKRNWSTNAPWWWKQTEEARQQAADDFDAEHGGKPQGKIPWTVLAHLKGSTAALLPQGLKPWVHFQNQTFWGEPDQTYAQVIRDKLLRPAHSIWEADPQVGRYDTDTGEGIAPPNFQKVPTA